MVETITSYKNFRFSRLPNSDNYTLNFDAVDTEYVVSKSSYGITKTPIASNTQGYSIELNKIMPNDIPTLRKSGKPVFICKELNQYWYCELPSRSLIISATKFGVEHKCALMDHECNRLSAASDEDGGCLKVRNRVLNLARYPFVTRGFQTYNLVEDCCVIVECCNYTHCARRSDLTSKEKNLLKKFLFDYYTDSNL